jgi:hypothetical protein
MICYNTPIARIGVQKYLGKEIGLNERPHDLVAVYRLEEDVFDKRTIASFEGKCVVEDHPPEVLTPENTKIYMKGVATNVHRGNGEDAKFLMADLIIYDEELIDKIKGGKTQLSCGYECCYNSYQDSFKQTDMVGNHIAVVDDGRAGERVMIRDEKPLDPLIESPGKESKEDNEGRRTEKMGYTLPRKSRGTVKDFLAAIGLKSFATDAEPEEVMEAVDDLAEEKVMDLGKDAEIEELKEKQEVLADVEGEKEALQQQIMLLQQKLRELMESEDGKDGKVDEAGAEGEKDDSMQSLEALEADEDPEVLERLEADNEPIIEEESMGDLTEDGYDLGKSSPTPEDPNAKKVQRATKTIIKDSDSAALLAVMKPIIAGIADKGARKKAADSLAAVIQLERSSNQKYAKMTTRATRDSAPDSRDSREIGRMIRDKYNPHYKNNKNV